MELSTKDKERIEQEGRKIASYVLGFPSDEILPDDSVLFGATKGAEYATIYEREQQIKTLNRPGSKYYVSYDPDYKDKVFGVFNKEDLTQQGAQKMARQLNNLEAERSELTDELKKEKELSDQLAVGIRINQEIHESEIKELRNKVIEEVIEKIRLEIRARLGRDEPGIILPSELENLLNSIKK